MTSRDPTARASTTLYAPPQSRDNVAERSSCEERAAMIVAFGPYELDDVAGTVRCREGVVALQPRVYDVLHYLVQHRDRVVSGRELTNVFWDGRSLNRGAVPWTIGHARKALAAHA